MPTNWAVVIGVDNYPSATNLRLQGAVRDALAMTDRLLRGPDPLIASASQIKLLLSPAEGSPKPPDSLTVLPATRKNIINEIKDVAQKGNAGRLFFHFSGHGLLAPGLAGGEAILPEEYEPDLPDQSIRLDGILDYLRIAKFDEQFFFIDACRNIPLPGLFHIGQFPPAPAEKIRPAVKQHVLCATSRGVTAKELRMTPNEERGVFSEALVRGLSGEGGAKVYDSENDRYLVTVGRLLAFVRGEVRRTVETLKLAADGEFPQEPRLRAGDLADTEAVVAALPPSAVPAAKLGFTVTPAAAAAATKLQVLGDATDEQAGPPVDQTTLLTLPQRDYRVIGRAAGFVPVKKSWPALLYGDTKLELVFKPAPPSLTESAPAAPAPDGPSSLKVWTSDPLAIVSVVDAGGRAVASGREAVKIEDIAPGIYRAFIQTPSGPVSEQTVVVEYCEAESVQLEPPPPDDPGILAGPVRGLSGSGLTRSMGLAEAIGASSTAFGDITSRLAMGVSAAMRDVELRPRRALLSVRSIDSARRTAAAPGPAALHLLAADDSPAAKNEGFASASAAVWPIGDRSQAVEGGFQSVRGLKRGGEFTAPLTPGCHLLSIAVERPATHGQDAAMEKAVFIVPALAGRVTNVILHRDAGADISASYFFPRKTGGHDGEIALQRRLQLAQRFYRAGHLSETITLLQPAPGDKDRAILESHEDPIAGLLEAYSLLQLAHTSLSRKQREGQRHLAALTKALGSLETNFSTLSDVSVLQADAVALAGGTAAKVRKLCADALDKGLPLFAFGAQRLLSLSGPAPKRKHPHRKLLEAAVRGKVAGLAVTAWVDAGGGEPQ